MLLLAGSLGCGEGSVQPLPAPFTSVTTGLLHTCGLVGDGAAYCWGDNRDGQLGDGSRSTRTWPVPVLGNLRFEGLSAGGNHTCGLASDGRVFCWGLNQTGQLGDGTTTSRSTPGPVTGALTFTTVEAGATFTCGLTTDGRAFCWGWNDFGQVGDGSTFSRVSPVEVSGGLTFSLIRGGAFHTCGLTTDGAAYCWGSNDFGQLGTGEEASSSVPVRVAGDLTFVDLDAGFQHTCGVAQDGAAYCWGRNHYGQVGNGLLGATQSLPDTVAGDLLFSSVTLGAGGFFTCGVEAGTGAGYCWGYNGSLQLGADFPADCEEEGGFVTRCSPVPVAVSGGLTFDHVSAGTQHTCGLATEGAHCWGLGEFGQLGNGEKGRNVFTFQPVRVAGQP